MRSFTIKKNHISPEVDDILGNKHIERHTDIDVLLLFLFRFINSHFIFSYYITVHITKLSVSIILLACFSKEELNS